MKSKLKNQQNGFTIIEVLIVLAIAGLIILIVFLAVPALQRTSRNTQRKNDASRFSSLVNEHVSNNAGKLPSAIGTGAGELNLANTSFTIMETPVSGDIKKSGGTGTALDLGTLDKMILNTGATCNNNTVTAGGGTRSYTVSYEVEASNGPQPQCL